MANISIERKERSGATPWIVAGIALVVLLVWFMFFRASERVASHAPAGAAADSALQVDSSRRPR